MAESKTKRAKKIQAEHRDAPGSGLTKAEAKKALDAATKAITSLKKQADKNYWQIGRRLNAVAELELHKAAGLGTIGDYAESALDLSRSTASSYMRVAAAFGEEIRAPAAARRGASPSIPSRRPPAYAC